jgi:hypothetical protein
MVQAGAAGAVGAGEAVAEVDPFGVDAELDLRLVLGGDVLLVGIVKSPQDGVTVTKDLHTLLAEAGEHDPTCWSDTPPAALWCGATLQGTFKAAQAPFSRTHEGAYKNRSAS